MFADAIERARALVTSFGTGGVGGYTDSRGSSAIREEVADFIQRRDGHRPNPEVRYCLDVPASAMLVLSSLGSADACFDVYLGI